MNKAMKELYFRRALKKKPRLRRLPRQLYPERVEAQYQRALIEILTFIKGRINARVKPLLPGLVAHYGRVRKDEFDEPAKYYTAFIYDNGRVSPDVLHCTHKYLGELSRADVLRVEREIDEYFLKPRKLPGATFDEVKFFGPEKNVRVLTPRTARERDFFPDLRQKLDAFRKDDFPFSPHVSTPKLRSLSDPFTNFALISKRGIHRSWPKEVRFDADDLQDLADALEQVRFEFTQEYTPEELKTLAKLTGKNVEEFNAAQMSGQLKGVVEIDLFGSEPWLAREMEAFVVQNVALISSLGDEYTDQVEKLIATSVRSGLRVEEIASAIDERYDVAESRARLIARDQVGKFNGQLTELRQKDLGIDGYIWRGVGDARERDSHRILNNTRQTWDDPPDVGHPGEDIQCRCWSEPDLANLYGDEA